MHKILPYFLTTAWMIVAGEPNLERTNALSLLLASIQCFPSGESENGETQRIIDLNKSFNPEDHLNEYKYPNRVQLLLEFLKNESQSRASDDRNDDPFTNSPEDIEDFSLILNVLYPNAQNWELFYNTSVWLLDKVSSAELFWALMVISGEKFSDSIVVPTSVEIFPQLFVNKNDVLKVAGMSVKKKEDDVFPISYWLGDPGLNEFHTHWHVDNPFWWNEQLHEVTRYRRGELFLYMHHQLVCRFEAEMLSNGLPEFPPLDLDANYQIPEGYTADIVNINYKQFPERKKGTPLGEFGNSTSLGKLQSWFKRLSEGIDEGYFHGPNDTRISLREENNTDILGNTIESSPLHSANFEYYGSFHNYLHRELAGMSGPYKSIPGVEGHSETAIRDSVFFRLHKRIDSLYHQLKTHAQPYKKNELDFPGISVKTARIESPNPMGKEDTTKWTLNLKWPSFTPEVPTLRTYFTSNTYDISTAARPCRNISHPGTHATVTTLTHVPFRYIITLQSSRSQVAFGIVRVFMWPETTYDGKKLEGDAAHSKAIEMDRFRVRIDPGQDTIITRSSFNCSFTKLDQAPGIKQLFAAKEKSNIFKPGMTRACGFPNNLLVPRGTKEGVKYKLTVYVSDETDQGWNNDYPNYPFCGALNGVKFPDRRPMGFPFDRPGTKFVANEGLWPVIAPSSLKNVKEVKILIKHMT